MTVSADDDVWPLLARGGLRPVSEPEEDDDQRPVLSEVRLPKYNGLRDPAGAEQLGKLLAERARPYQPSVVLLWDDAPDVVLGHVVGRELGISAVRSYDREGLIDLDGGSLPAGSRVLLLVDAFRDAGLLRAMCNLVARARSTVVATAVLVETDVLDTAAGMQGVIVSLASARRVRQTRGAA